jgi:hypothetical protein
MPGGLPGQFGRQRAQDRDPSAHLDANGVDDNRHRRIFMLE